MCRRTLLDLFGLRDDVRAGDLADELRVVGAEVRLRLFPELVVVLAFDDLPAHAIDLLHEIILGTPASDEAQRSHELQAASCSRPVLASSYGRLSTVAPLIAIQQPGTCSPATR